MVVVMLCPSHLLICGAGKRSNELLRLIIRKQHAALCILSVYIYKSMCVCPTFLSPYTYLFIWCVPMHKTAKTQCVKHLEGSRNEWKMFVGGKYILRVPVNAQISAITHTRLRPPGVGEILNSSDKHIAWTCASTSANTAKQNKIKNLLFYPR